MKNFLLYGLTLWMLCPLWGQKHDRTWIIGVDNCEANLIWKGTSDCTIDTDSGFSARSSCRDDIFMMYTNASICDTDGTLQFYSTGCRIYDTLDQVMPGGDSINYGDGEYWDAYNGAYYPVSRGAMALPWPDSTGRYALFHQYARDTLFYFNGNLSPRALGLRLYCTKVDMSLNGGLGAVSERETLVGTDTFSTASLSACRHANGRDWWIILPLNWTNCYELWLFEPGGVRHMGRQCLGHTFFWGDWWGQAGFSPDGEWYARNTSNDDLHLYRFDRCTGLLSDHLALPYVGNPARLGDVDPNTQYGVGFSPGSRFLYASVSSHLYQYDLHAPDIQASRFLADSFVYFYDPVLPVPQDFSSQLLGPDGRLYVLPYRGRYVHYLEFPDSLGSACLPQQHALFSASVFRNPPSFPHFRSGPLEGSACDTLGLNSLSSSTDWLDFGSVPPGGDSLRGFWARSHVGYPATVRQLDLPAGGPFAAGPLAPLYAIPKYDSVWVPVRFAPLQTGAFDDTLYLRTNYGHLAVRLTGTSDTITSNLPAAPQYSALRLWPNPTAGNVQLSFSASHAGETLLTVHDALGRAVLSLPVQVVAGSNRFALPLEGLPGGVYSVMLRGVGAGRVVKN